MFHRARTVAGHELVHRRDGQSSTTARTTSWMMSDMVKVKFSHTRYRALGPELIPVYRQSARRSHEVNHAIYSAVVCRCFLPGLRLPS